MTASCPVAHRTLRPIAAGLALALAGPVSALQPEDPSERRPPVVERLKRMSLEELMTLRVSSVSKRPEQRIEAAAAVAVITGDDLRRSGVTTLADALRLAPGVHVAQIDSNKWAVGIRGFANRFSRAVLVLIDGRSVYTPLFAGTYWEVQDTLLEDVDRIEVIRGPGGTLWGANAYSGVINIITKSSRETHGGLVSGGVGTHEEAFAAYRHGGVTAGGLHHRVYVKGFERDAGLREDGIEYDDWGSVQAGFRLDWDATERDSFTLQGDAYSARVGQRSDVVLFAPPFLELAEEDADLDGANLLWRWTRAFEGGGETRLQTYGDWTHRREPTFTENRATLDVDFQHALARHGRHRLIWGADYRVTSDDTEALAFLGVEPADRTVGLFSAFVQDEMSFADDKLRLIVGTKLEKHDFSDFEVQPNVRFLWLPAMARETAVWAAVSRAVRTPSRVDQDLFFTQPMDPTLGVFPRITGSRDFESEEVTAFEVGVRVHAARSVFVDFTAFHNEFDELLGFEPGAPFIEIDPGPPHAVVPLVFDNSLSGTSHGIEVAGTWDVSEDWRLEGWWSYLDIDLERDPGSMDSLLVLAEGQAPRQQAVLRSHFDVGSDWEVDAILRWVDELPANQIDDYFTADLRFAWSPRPGLEVALVGHDLLSDHHREFEAPSIGASRGGSDSRRGVYGKVTWRY